MVDKGGGSRTLARGLTVLRALGEAGDGATVAELSSTTSLDRAVLYRLLETLCQEGFTRKDVVTKRYHLGVALVDLGTRAAASLEVRKLAGPRMRELMRQCGEAVCLAVPEGADLVVVERIEPAGRFVKVAYDIGLRHSLLVGAHGRALAAFLPEEELRAVTNGQVVDEAVLEQIRTVGYAVSSDELETGTSGIAAAIFDRHGRAVASLGVVAPTPRLPDPSTLGEALLAVAGGISQRLGWAG